MQNSLRYNTFNQYLKTLFGTKVYRIALDAGFSCPNRDKGGGCIYCDARGSGTGAWAKKISVEEQLRTGIQRYRKWAGAEKFIAYFQAFSNTYLPVDRLKTIYDIPLKYDDIVGISIGTRPDCIDEEKIQLIQGYTSRFHTWVEYGLQSAHETTLEKIRRGHSVDKVIRAVELTKDKGINICLHVILGLPGESHNDMMQTADFVAHSGVDAVKIHLLHVVKGSVLEQMYYRSEIELMDQQTYVRTVCDFLERLPETMFIQRLTGERHPEMLIAPQWCLHKGTVLRDITYELKRRNSYQGKNFS